MNPIGLAGLGRMGSAMAERLAAAGFPITVFNRTAEKAHRFAEAHGAGVAETPEALAASSEIILTVLSDGPATEELLDAGLLSGLRNGAVVANMATTSPTEAESLAERVSGAGGAFVDSPVSGSVATAAAGELTIMAGGAEADVVRLQPVFDVIGGRCFHMGAVGTGVTIKLGVNSMLFAINQALAESLVLAERAGIDRSLAYDVIESSAAGAPVVAYRRDVFEFPGERPVTFTIDLARKDLHLALGLAARLGVDMPQAIVNTKFMDDASAIGLGGADMGDVARILRAKRRS